MTPSPLPSSSDVAIPWRGSRGVSLCRFHRLQLQIRGTAQVQGVHVFQPSVETLTPPVSGTVDPVPEPTDDFWRILLMALMGLMGMTSLKHHLG